MRSPLRLCIIALLAASFPSLAYTAEALTAERYLELVERDNPAVRSADLSVEASRKKILELDMVYSPYVTGNYSYTDDRGGSGFGSTLQAEHMRANALSVNLNKKFMFGTTVSAGYTNNIAAFSLAEPLSFGGTSLSSFTGYDMKPVVRAEQSLLRDFRSGLTRSGIQKTRSASLAQQYMQLLARQQTLMKAKIAYWSLSLSREVVAFRAASLERTGELLRWNESRFKRDLSDKSDLLQAQAGYRLRELNLQQSKEDEKNVCRDFNELLGASCTTVDYTLERISDRASSFENVAVLRKTGDRADVLATRALYKSSRYADRETKYRSMPELSVFGQYSLYGLGLSNADAWKQVRDTVKPSYTVGLALIVPLDYKTLMTIRQGYKQDFEASRESSIKAELASKNDWDQLQRTWQNVKTRLSLAQQIKTVQEQRVSNEQSLLKRGRTTTFNVLNAENDLDDATLNVYRLVFEELSTIAQADMFNALPFEDDTPFEEQ